MRTDSFRYGTEASAKFTPNNDFNLTSHCCRYILARDLKYSKLKSLTNDYIFKRKKYISRHTLLFTYAAHIFFLHRRILIFNLKK
jgi:hypothetical protein